MADTSATTRDETVCRPPLRVRIAMTITRLQRLAATAETRAARDAAGKAAHLLEGFLSDPASAQRSMRLGFVRAATAAELAFAAHIARLFGLALRLDGWQQRGGVDWGGTPELMQYAGDFAREYLPGFQKMLIDAARAYLDDVLPVDGSVLN